MKQLQAGIDESVNMTPPGADCLSLMQMAAMSAERNAILRKAIWGANQVISI